MNAEAVVAEALGGLSTDQLRSRLRERYASRVMERFAASVRGCLDRWPDPSRRHGLVPTARRILGGEGGWTLALDPALGRWVAAMEDALQSDGGAKRAEGLLLLLPRFAVSVALTEGLDLDVQMTLGSAGRARVPVDGRMLQGPPGRLVRVAVQGGELVGHARPPARVGPFELVGGDAEGGKLAQVRPQSGTDLFTPARVVKRAVDILEKTAPVALGEVGVLAPVLVPLSTDESVSESGSLTEARQCIWMSVPDRPLVVAETLIHEASHLLFFLVEDALPLVVDPDPPRLEVPWRSDQRPLRAVMMGLHAWVRILRWLRALEGTEWSQPAGERRELLEPAVSAASELVQREEAGLTEQGRALAAEMVKLHAGG